jgi:2,4-dienoyl-CoA reductase-like NADH-dependent reductase (Old Yellow Enzyme family)/thioredoxin reductase
MHDADDRVLEEFALLQSPLNVGSRTLRNRVITTAHGSFDPWGAPELFERYLSYQRARSAGGVGMIIMHPLYVEPDPRWPLPMADRLQRIAETLHADGAVAVQQIVNMGGQMSTRYNLGGRPLWSFNGMQSPGGEVSHRMADEEIVAVVEAYARTARTATEAGIDGVELHGAHGYLIQQSFSPWGNNRIDRWGEPLAFTRAVVEATRAAIGPDPILGFRIAEWDERSAGEGGLSPKQFQEIARSIVDGGEIDYLNTSIGSKAPDYAQLAVATYRQKPGHELQYTHDMRAAIGARVPVVGVGRIVDPHMAEAALRNGDCDLVAMTRAHISDPAIVAKIAGRETSRIRKCVGANECVDRKLAGLPAIACFHNPDVGQETLGPIILASHPKHLLVVGAGPGGLKAAEVAALRGHHVTLVDRNEHAGGQLRFVQHTAAAELLGAIDHLVSELHLLGVKPQLGLEVDADLLERLHPDAVVLATGARRTTTGAFSGTDRPGVLTSCEALTSEPGPRVIVLDRLGDNEAALVAEALAGKGRAVTLVTPFDSMAPFAGYTHRKDLSQFFRRSGTRLLTETDIAAFDGQTARVADPEGRTVANIRCDAIVAVTGPVPDVSLHPVLRRLGVPFHPIGDAVAPRGVSTAIREANTYLRSL